MSGFEFIWMLFLLSALQPVVARKFMDASRQQRISQIERERGSRVIVLIHRQETMGFLGFPLMKYIDMQDSEQVLRAIHMTDDDIPLDIIVHTPGGLVLASVQIARAIRAHPSKVTVFVPHMAMSGGTLIALAGDEVIMCEHSVLGPIDPQINQKPAVSIIKAVDDKPISEVDDETLIQADVARKAIAQLRETVGKILPQTMPGDAREKLIGQLVDGKWTHDYPILAEDAAGMGIPISTKMPETILELMTMYPQTKRMQRSVEFSPGPRAPAPQEAQR
ncbi:MAG: ATP-dependent Clp protease proteolytic subunit [Pseudomonadota bacterium]